ncbi:hypothetical protein SAY87_011547 [Trapa incisa]|uniref:Pentatricopeptide repeat-containing protein n=1 Tax=Trapa incisa TaxID=236973 RepID=A0AAN7GFQ7_9MYRT|nr:hypothetical protein SAY87_011547 [Trapa incisa]
MASARRVFDAMKVKTTVTWNSLLAGYAKIPGKFMEARKLFGEIPEPDCVSSKALDMDIKVCDVMRKGLWPGQGTCSDIRAAVSTHQQFQRESSCEKVKLKHSRNQILLICTSV